MSVSFAQLIHRKRLQNANDPYKQFAPKDPPKWGDDEVEDDSATPTRLPQALGVLYVY